MKKKPSLQKTKAKRVEDYAICPGCGEKVETHRCRLCGAQKAINPVSGNEIWMRNGRVVDAFKDSKIAFMRMATQYGIPEAEWPDKFK